MQNLFCKLEDLRNEADVEQNFVRRLLEDLGYSDKAIRPKESLEALSVGTLSSTKLHRPDFALKVAGHIRWILEAKAPNEPLDKHFRQANGYCEAINASYVKAQPVVYFVLSNGAETRLYKPGDTTPVLTLRFRQFENGNVDYETFRKFVGFTRLAPQATPKYEKMISLRKPSISEINRIFANCHQYIYQSDRISQAKGFEEFVKLIALKLRSDKAIRESYPGVLAEKAFYYPAESVLFSMRWINENEASAPNPINTILFHKFMTDLEGDIARRLKKRIFDSGEGIGLKPETIKGVVERMERLFLFGIDADLNGRLFEQFLSVTMRGQDLGQYFTPRTLVKMGVRLANLRTTDVILDGCCGTGGFLIDALADMWGKINRNASLSEHGKAQQRKNVADNQIYGIDFGRSPNLAKIARLNMYLHGDGGSRIFNVDALDMAVTDHDHYTPEELAENEELRNAKMVDRFDVVITNPPFRKQYERNQEGDARVMEQYEIAAGKQMILAKLLFFEMYHRYLKPGGLLISVIDDGFLSTPKYSWFRDMIRSLYIVKAVISLPGDAFQRSKARVKTSFIILEKRKSDTGTTEQPAIFMYGCRYVGNDDPSRDRKMPGDDELRANAQEEVEAVVSEFHAFLSGKGNSEFIVPREKAINRLDVKHCMIERGTMVNAPRKLGDFVQLRNFEPDDVIDCSRHDEPVRYLEVEYAGVASAGREIIPVSDTEYKELYRVHPGDIVLSNIAAHYGSAAIVPDELDGFVVSSEYTILSPLDGTDVRVVWAVLRSPEIRAEMLLSATGANRTRIKWPEIRRIPFPYPDPSAIALFVEHYEKSRAAIKQAAKEYKRAERLLNENLKIGQDRAQYILDAFKPPK